MNFLKKGPQLKMPSKMPSFKRGEMKVPGWMSDIYYELNERHLLPLVIVLVAAIIAVPIALSESGGAEEIEEEAAIAAISSTPAGAKTTTVVAKSVPGLRSYKRRLEHLTAKDPFEKPGAMVATEEALEEVKAKLSEALEGGGEEATPETEGSSPENGGSSGEQTVKYFTWQAKLRYVPVSKKGKKAKADPRMLTVLTHEVVPDKQTPAAVFLGATEDKKKALLLVSSAVKSVFGDAPCFLGGETCELLALEKGVPETFAFGEDEEIFRLELRDLSYVVTKETHDAPPLEAPSSASAQLTTK